MALLPLLATAYEIQLCSIKIINKPECSIQIINNNENCIHRKRHFQILGEEYSMASN